LKAAIGLYRETSADEDAMVQARRTVQAQLRELVSTLDYDLTVVVDSNGKPIAALLEQGESDIQLDSLPQPAIPHAILKVRDRLYETTMVPINMGNENLGNLIVGRKFDFGSLNRFGYAALFDGEQILLSSFPLQSGVLQSSIASQCGGKLESCELEVDGLTFLILSVERVHLGAPYRLFTFQPIDSALEQFTRGFKPAFLLIGACGVLTVLMLSIAVSHSVSRPLTDLVTHLRDSEKTGELSPNFHTTSSTKEVNHLAEALNRAAGSVRESQQSLEDAYLQFVETMAQALDARDSYTAGHSHRVREYSLAVAQIMGLTPRQVEIIHFGADLHDIGKIGVPDAVLQKPGRLTLEEFELIKQHPQIGKKILGKVGRFENYLPIVELHHENHDGSGYPHGLKGNEIPLEARIVHVADVYDAITSDRAYRKAMSQYQVLEILENGAGTQFDPRVVAVFLSWLQQQEALCEESLATV
jgi:HD-GYP domain-containing protein (c-di-GMP phosphodiesterase class II)